VSPPALSPDVETERIYRAMLAEIMRPCRELPRGERAAKRVEDRRLQRQL
jgi:hypothetical protein